MMIVEAGSGGILSKHSALEEVQMQVADTLYGILEFGEEDTIDVETPLMSAGITSGTAVVLRNQLAGIVPGGDLPYTLIFDYPSIAAISEYIQETLAKRG
eukprot:NODE_7582_length_432_cov_2.084881.p3 GENE.NODE_7582_length_432_cov_2.084881~~NODE_7582_length_432_cov_2.084881.p3  ORF type:complete len:100 (+),score=46.42 NODE_7582_length_432_cov_2.084881:2-301(+)